ncbi:unnamed protein product [Brassica oleracea var. botrytis]|uniref:DUF4283 domain-containing protein n=1 Tax=Brassica oleracea TaxID=3712 RepID=A0A3P6DX35_BRAOL|nr:unnamed protein product [Brassica oleracea]
MGSLSRVKSAHMADLKRKGILYEDDDEPIRLTDQDGSQVIKEFRMSLIGKVLNAKKQNVEKLLQTMPSQWGMADRITANDLRNGKFLFNFSCEEDLKSVLRKGPFHYNYCMFVLVRWEPIVHDDYPWIIPFWVRVIGIPLHLWNVNNLRSIGGRLGHVDTLELEEGRMLIDIDSRRPLKFKRKGEYEGEEVTIEFKYDMLFKHCTTCGLMSHEKGYYPTINTNRPQSLMERGESLHECSYLMSSMSDQHKREVESSRQSRQKDDRTKEVTSRWSEAGRNHDYRGRHYDENTYQGGHSGATDRYMSRTNRIIRRRHEVPKGSRYGGSRYGGKPYDRHVDQTWREKKVVKDSVMEKRVADPLRCSSQSHDVVPYEHTSDKNLTPSREELTQRTVEQASGGNQGVKRLASAIVTPSHDPPRMVDNVTVRDRSVALSLTFSPNVPAVEAENDQMIGALNDMELLDTGDGGMMDCDGQDDDLLYDDLMDIEEQARSSSLADVSTAHKAHKGIKGARSGAKLIAPLGIQSKKNEFHRRGSPRMRSIKQFGRTRSTETGKARRHASKITRGSSSTSDGLMGSKYPSKHHL